MPGTYTGIKLLEYEESTGAFSGLQTSLGCPLASSPSLTPEPQVVENAKGQELYAGNKDTSEWHIDDLTLFAALKTIMEADTEIDIRVTFLDDSTEIIHLNSLAKVSKTYNAQVGSKNYFIFKCQVYRIT